MKIIYSAFLLFFLNVITVNFAIEIPDHLKSHAKKLHERCKKDIGVTDAQLMSSWEGTVERNVQCYLHCLFDKVGLIDEKHIVHLENLIEILPEGSHATIQNLVEKCGTQHGADGCETAYLTTKCYIETEPLLRSKLSFMLE